MKRKTKFLIGISFLICLSVIIVNVIADISYETWGGKLFTLLLNLTYSYLAAWIFYLIINYLPRKEAEKKNLISLSEHFSFLLSHMFHFVAMEKYICGVEDMRDDELSQIDFLEPKRLMNNGRRLFVYYYNDGVTIPSSISFKQLQSNAISIRDNANEILKIASQRRIDQQILDILFKISESLCIKQLCLPYDIMEAEEDEMFKISTAPLNIIDFIEMRDSLLSQTLPQRSYNISYAEMPQENIPIYKKNINEILANS